MLKAFDRRPRPAAVGEATWTAARDELLRWLGTLMTRMPKTTDAIADSCAASLLALMPVHDRLGRDDYARLRGALHLGLAVVADRFILSANAAALATTLAATS